MSETTKQITINLSDVTNNVKEHLAIIGKRIKDSTGKSLFSSATLSSQELSVISDYISSAFDIVAGQLVQVVVSTQTTGTYNFAFSNSRWYSNGIDISNPFVDAFVNYVNSYVIAQILEMYAPEYAKKYEEQAATHLNVLKQLVFNKQPPTENFSDPSGSFS